MKEIKLTQGKVALVDDGDFKMVSKHTWHTSRKRYPFYARTKICFKNSILMHVLIMGKRQGFQIDHINRNSLDNRRLNLRFVTASQNQHNQKIRKTGTSYYKGVCRYHINKWQATIRHNGRLYHLGVYATQEKASEAYNLKAIELFGEFSNLNVPSR